MKFDMKIKPMDVKVDISDKTIYYNGELCKWLSWETTDDIDCKGRKFGRKTYLIELPKNKPLECRMSGIDENDGYTFYHTSKNPTFQFLGYWIMRCLTDNRNVNNYSNGFEECEVEVV